MSEEGVVIRCGSCGAPFKSLSDGRCIHCGLFNQLSKPEFVHGGTSKDHRSINSGGLSYHSVNCVRSYMVRS